MIKFTRTFHPVGQGAFYSERFTFENNLKFLTIYDCGTDLRDYNLGTPSQILKRLKMRINQDLGPANPKTSKHEVELLFLSHFDEDHVSGVHFLNPKIVVIPLLTKDEIIYYEIINFLQISNINMNLLLNPKRFFGDDTTVIGVRPEEEGENYAEGREIVINEEGRITNQATPNNHPNYPNVDIILPPGSAIILRNLWRYIVFNPKISELPLFKRELAKAGWNWDTLADDLKSNLDQNKVKKLHDIYKRVSSDLNSTSLLVYSGPGEAIKRFELFELKEGLGSCCCHCRELGFPCHICDFGRPLYRRIACMYFGDWKISQRKLQNYYTSLPLNGKLIGTVQIPHHGSVHNKGNLALELLDDPGFVKSIISCGNNNRFNHPSNLIISKIMDKGGEVILVTEYSASSIITNYRLFT